MERLRFRSQQFHPMRDGQFDLGGNERARVDCPGILGFVIANVPLRKSKERKVVLLVFLR